MRALVTGGAGFIGSALVRTLTADPSNSVVTLDKLTYAGNLDSLGESLTAPNHRFETGDIADATEVRRVIHQADPEVIFHLAAESHVDRSIDGPEAFVRTNVTGTYVLLTETVRFWSGLPTDRKRKFRFLHVSTDEVFGSLGPTGFFSEDTPYDPSSPYSATKAASDHLVRAWSRTYNLPSLITNCSNNYGPYQFPEKLIPHMIVRALAGETLPVYGTGDNVRDWLHVSDHVSALLLVSERGAPGETYLVSGNNEVKNLDLVRALCRHLDAEVPRGDGRSYLEQIAFVTDRPGHDHRYAIDASKLRRELGWGPSIGLEEGLRSTIRWYLANAGWWQRILSGDYRAVRSGLAPSR